MCRISAILCVAIAMVAMLAIVGLQQANCAEAAEKDERQALFIKNECYLIRTYRQTIKSLSSTEIKDKRVLKQARRDTRERCTTCCKKSGYKYGGLHGADLLTCVCGDTRATKLFSE